MRWDKRLMMPKSEGGATICEKHDFIAEHFRDPDMSWEVDQAVAQAKDDGKRIEARLQELGEEANNLEEALQQMEYARDRLQTERDALAKELERVRSAAKGVEPYMEEDPDDDGDYNERVRAFRAAPPANNQKESNDG